MSMPPSPPTHPVWSFGMKVAPFASALIILFTALIAGMSFSYGWGKDSAANELALYKGIKDINLVDLTSNAVAAASEMREAAKGLNETLVTNKQFIEAKKTVETMRSQLSAYADANKKFSEQNTTLIAALHEANEKISALTTLGQRIAVEEGKSEVVPGTGLHIGLVSVSPAGRADINVSGAPYTAVVGQNIAVKTSFGKNCTIYIRQVKFHAPSFIYVEHNCSGE
jgi:hypothetical protein